MKSLFIAACLAAGAAGLCCGQTQPAPAGFEVASVKAAPALDFHQTVAFSRQIDGAQVRFTQASLRDLIRIAWNIRDYQIEAPAWLTSARFDVSARLPAGHTQKEVPAMLQALLADRFALKIRRDSKEMPVYALVVHAGGLKIKASPPDDSDEQGADAPEEVKLSGGGGHGGSIQYGHGSYFALPHYRMEARKISMTLFASLLGNLTDRPVIDQTGLSARYDIDLPLAEEDYDAMMVQAGIVLGDAPSPKELQQMAALGDPLPKVLRTLGLDLKPRKGRVDVVVVESVRKEPFEN